MKNFGILGLLLIACHREPAPTPHAPPARVEHAQPESELPIVRFSARALSRLAIQTAQVEAAKVPGVRLVGGEVVIPPGRTMSVAAPVAGVVRPAAEGALRLSPGATVRRGEVILRLIPLAPVDRDIRARGEREVLATSAQLEAAEARVTRIAQLNTERASSQRAYEEAVAARDVALADVKAARARVQQTQDAPLLADIALSVRAPDHGIVRVLSVVPGQAVAAGAPLVEIVAADALQLRVPIYAGDLARIDAAQPATVRALGAALGEAREAAPITGPPTADPVAATVDRYFALPAGSAFAPGERVLVELSLRSPELARSAPWAAVVYDASGAAWVYACAGERAFRRERIDPLRRAGEHVVFTRGPALAACVASVGAAEIFGSEFEPGH
jgi:multidrug efflux pump subunit AcrA (membrane-fusion protein)